LQSNDLNSKKGKGQEPDWSRAIERDRKYCFHPNEALSEWIPFPVGGCDGAYIIDAKGNRILDFHSGMISVNAGQRNRKIVEAIKDALDNYGYVWEAFTTPQKSRAAEMIVEDILGPDRWAGKAHFLGSGSEANEEALQIAKLYTNHPFVVTREYAYHGWTQGAGACTRMNWVRGSLASPTSNEHRPVPGFPSEGYFPAPAPYCYRCPYGYNGPNECQVGGQVACLSEMEHMILSIGPENVAAVITELISNGSLVVSPKEWVIGLRELTKRYGILFIDDEVMTGFGRTGKWFCYQHYGITPDIMTMGKGMASSALPAAGVVVSKEIGDYFDRYRWWHVATFSSHPAVMAAVVANISYMIEEDLLGRSERMGRYLEKRLREIEPKHRCVGNISGMGLFWGIEIVRNARTKEPFVKEGHNVTGAGQTSHWPTNLVHRKALEKGVLIGEWSPNIVRLGPALIVTEEEIDRGVDALDYGLSAVDAECG
jgi:taurine--2-oxoglutarate transaminase